MLERVAKGKGMNWEELFESWKHKNQVSGRPHQPPCPSAPISPHARAPPSAPLPERPHQPPCPSASISARAAKQRCKPNPAC